MHTCKGFITFKNAMMTLCRSYENPAEIHKHLKCIDGFMTL